MSFFVFYFIYLYVSCSGSPRLEFFYYFLMVIMWFLLGGVSSSSECLRLAALFIVAFPGPSI